jgi:hypothetical protein
MNTARTSITIFLFFIFVFASHKVLVWPWERDAAADEHEQPSFFDKPVQKRPLDSRTQLLTTIVKSLNDVTVPVWRALQESCMSRPTVVSILYAGGTPSIVREHMLEDYCSDVIMYHQWEVEGSEEVRWRGAKKEAVSKRRSAQGTMYCSETHPFSHLACSLTALASFVAVQEN